MVVRRECHTCILATFVIDCLLLKDSALMSCDSSALGYNDHYSFKEKNTNIFQVSISSMPSELHHREAESLPQIQFYLFTIKLIPTQRFYSSSSIVVMRNNLFDTNRSFLKNIELYHAFWI